MKSLIALYLLLNPSAFYSCESSICFSFIGVSLLVTNFQACPISPYTTPPPYSPPPPTPNPNIFPFCFSVLHCHSSQYLLVFFCSFKNIITFILQKLGRSFSVTASFFPPLALSISFLTHGRENRLIKMASRR